MLSRTLLRNTKFGFYNANIMRNNLLRQQMRVFSNDVGISDVGDVLKVNYTEEFDQGLTDE